MKALATYILTIAVASCMAGYLMEGVAAGIQQKAAQRDAAIQSVLNWGITMIYQVQGFYASGRFVSHLVGASDANEAIASVLAADNRIIRITRAVESRIWSWTIDRRAAHDQVL
jgi:hypothetical protein